MAAWKRALQRDAPPWVIYTLAFVAVVALGYFGWKAVAGQEPDPGPPKQVYPGMYDLRAEVAKMRAARQQGASQSGRSR